MYKTVSSSEGYETVWHEINETIIGENDYELLPIYSGEISEDESTATSVSVTVWITRLPFSECGQTIEFGKNLIDLEEMCSSNDIYTCVVPIGNGNISIFSEDEYSSLIPVKDRQYYVTGSTYYGIIDKAVNFGNIEDKDMLREAGETLLSAGGGTAVPKFTISTVDLSLLLDNDPNHVDAAFTLGSGVNVISAPHGINSQYVCRGKEIDLLDPSNSKYDFSLPAKLSPETFTSRIYDTVADMSSQLNRKLTLGQTCGIFNLDKDSTSLAFFMPPSISGKFPCAGRKEHERNG